MSLRLEMLQVARLGPRLLGESLPLVRDFICRQRNEDGGFKGRDGKSDLYYTVFGLEALLALDANVDPSPTNACLRSFVDLEQLDFVHLCCLARCWADVATRIEPADRGASEVGASIAFHLQRYRSADGGFNPVPGASNGSAYAAFLALGAYQDCGLRLPDPQGLIGSLQALQTPDGAYTNDSCLKVGSTNATAAAVAILRNLEVPVKPAVATWLLERCLPTGGFLAVPRAPVPDLLSTATALHALGGLGCDLSAIKEPCLDFLDSLWTNEGGFHGHWADDFLDCEYTYYGLLALGHLSF